MISPVRDWRLIGALALFGSVFVLMGVACVYGWHAEYQDFRLRRIGVKTEAVVLSSNVRDRKAPARLEYQFRHGGDDYVASAFVSSSAQRRYWGGSKISVWYLPNEPEYSRPIGLEPVVGTFVYKLSLVTMSGVVLSVSGSLLWQIKKRKPIMKPGAFWMKPKLRRPRP